LKKEHEADFKVHAPPRGGKGRPILSFKKKKKVGKETGPIGECGLLKKWKQRKGPTRDIVMPKYAKPTTPEEMTRSTRPLSSRKGG